MKLWKKFALCMSLALLVTGCGNKDSKNPSSEEKSSKSGENVVRIAMWNPDQIATMKDIEKKYEEKNPGVDIQIEETTFKDHFTKLETQAQGDVMPDIFTMNGPNFIKFVSNGVIEPLDDYLDKMGIKKEDYPEGLINLYTYDNHLYGIPKDWDLTALFYNKKLFDEKGVSYPNKDWTWDDFVKAAEQLTDKDKGIWGTSFKPATQEGYYDTIPQCGGYIINKDKTKSGYDTEEAYDGIQRWIDIGEKGYSPDLKTLTDTNDTDLFKAGKIAMIYSGSWRIPEYLGDENISKDIDLEIMPKIKERAATIHGLSYCLAKGSKNKDQALDFLAYLGSKEVNEMWAEKATVIPANNKVLETWEKSYPDKNLKAFVDELEYSVPYPVSKNTPVWNAYEEDAINEMYSFNKPVKDVLKDLAQKMNDALEKEQN